MINYENFFLIETIISFDKLANLLIKRLANEYDLDLNQKDPFDRLLVRENDLWKGNLKDNWTYWFHGDACEFENTLTKQFVYVKINRKGNYGTIDNHYLYKFILTTYSFDSVRSKIKSEEHFMEMMNELEKERIIVNIENDEYLKTRVLNFDLLKNLLE